MCAERYSYTLKLTISYYAIPSYVQMHIQTSPSYGVDNASVAV